jgi:LysM repeat protein
MPELKPVSAVSSTLSIIFGAALVLLAAAAVFVMPGPGAAWLAMSSTPTDTPTRAASVATAAPSASSTAKATAALSGATSTATPARAPAPGSPTVARATPTPGASVTPAGTPAATPAATPTATTRTYVVQEGDTLSAIAEQFGVSAAAILQANGLEDADSLSQGQELTIPSPPAETPAPSVTAEPAPRPATTYVVEEGDTLLGIAIKFGVDVEDLTRVNGIDDANGLAVGQELTIP